MDTKNKVRREDYVSRVIVGNPPAEYLARDGPAGPGAADEAGAGAASAPKTVRAHDRDVAVTFGALLLLILCVVHRCAVFSR